MIDLEVLVWDKMPICMIARLPDSGKVYLCSLDKVTDGICRYECEPVSSEPELYERSLDDIHKEHHSTCLLTVPENMLKEESIPLSCLHEGIGGRMSPSA